MAVATVDDRDVRGRQTRREDSDTGLRRDPRDWRRPLPMLNQRTELQPMLGTLADPADDKYLQLQVEQRHAYDSLTRTMVRIGPDLEASDDPMAGEAVATLEATMTLLNEGGDYATMETGADNYEVALGTITPTLANDDLAAMNSVLTSLRFITTRLRDTETLPELPPVGTESGEVPPGANGDGSGDEAGLDAAPTVTDVPHATQEGQTLTCTMGNWSGAPDSYTYQWTVGGNPGTAGEQSTYNVQAGDMGQTASCVVTATNQHGTGTAPASNEVVIA